MNALDKFMSYANCYRAVAVPILICVVVAAVGLILLATRRSLP